MDKMIVLFIVVQFINIILSTLKTVLTVRGSKLTAASINAVAYTVGVSITWLIVDIPLVWSLPITFTLNLFGVYLGLSIIQKFKKNQLWRISTTVKTEFIDEYIREIRSEGIQLQTYLTGRENYEVVDIFSNSREETNKVVPILKKYNAKYTVLASDKVLY